MAGSKFCKILNAGISVHSGPHVVGCTDIMVGRTKEGTLMRLYYPSKVMDLMVSCPVELARAILSTNFFYI